MMRANKDDTRKRWCEETGVVQCIIAKTALSPVFSQTPLLGDSWCLEFNHVAHYVPVPVPCNRDTVMHKKIILVAPVFDSNIVVKENDFPVFDSIAKNMKEN